MVVTFLGTGTSQGVPVIGVDHPVCRSLDHRDKRLRASIMIETGDDLALVIDTGPDFRQQMLREQVQRVDAVLFTHQHKDHTAGLDDIRSFYFKQRQDIPVYGRAEVLAQIKKEYEYMFAAKKYPGVASVQINEILNHPFHIGANRIVPVEVMHHKLPVFGFRIGGFTYITDANYIAPEEMEKIRGTKILVINALQKDAHISHFTLQEALQVIDELQPERAYLTHISYKLGFHASVSAELPKNVYLAYDGLKLNIAD